MLQTMFSPKLKRAKASLDKNGSQEVNLKTKQFNPTEEVCKCKLFERSRTHWRQVEMVPFQTYKHTHKPKANIAIHCETNKINQDLILYCLIGPTE